MRGTRLYFLLLGWISASISLRKELSSCSASSSRESGFAAGGPEFEGVAVICVVDWGGIGGVLSPEEEVDGVDQSQPIVSVVVEVC